MFYINNKKVSTIPWLVTPKEWRISKFKYTSKLQTGNSIPHNEKDNYLDCIDANPYVATKDIEKEQINYRNGLYIKKDNPKFTVVGKKSTLLCIEGGSAGKKIAFTDRKVTFVNKLCAFSTEYLVPKFQFYYLNSSCFRAEFSFNVTGLIPGVSINSLKNHRIPVPKIETQKRIVQYLDHEVNRIDQILGLHEQGVEKLENALLSLIEITISSGIPTSNKTTKSISEFYNQVPNDWTYTRLKNLLEIVDERNNDEDARLLSIYTNIGVKPRSELEERGNKNSTVMNYKIVSKDDFIVNKLLAWMGAIGISSYSGVTSPDYDIYRVKKNKAIPKFLDYLFKTKFIKGECYKYGRGIMLMRWRTYSSEFLNIKVALPGILEQEEIVKFIEDKSENIMRQIEIKKKMIVKMRQSKESLIYEAVTGKIKI